MKWRRYLHAVAIVVNGAFALWLVSAQAWWMPVGYLGGVPFIVPPVVAIIALVVARPSDRGLGRV